MTENETIKGLMFLKEKLYNGIYADRLDCIDYAITALKEVQKYREIRTVEECRTAMDYWKYLRERRCGLDAVVEKCMEYEKIGTVEECRKAVEKQKPKKSIDYNEDLGYFKCPSCGCSIMADEFSDHKYCLNCGQKLEWKESEGE